MFFRREKPRTPSFSDRLVALKNRGFQITPQPSSTVRVERGGCAVEIRDKGGETPVEGRAGMLSGGQIASLVDGGYQKFFQTPGGVRKPATADELQALHDFEEDLRDTLGLTSLYNEGLGTVSTYYLYDRVQDRDRGVPKRVWE
jgi:hypothetical protein